MINAETGIIRANSSWLHESHDPDVLRLTKEKTNHEMAASTNAHTKRTKKGILLLFQSQFQEIFICM